MTEFSNEFERNEAIDAALAADPKKPARQIARELGISHPTVLKRDKRSVLYVEPEHPEPPRDAPEERETAQLELNAKAAWARMKEFFDTDVEPNAGSSRLDQAADIRRIGADHLAFCVANFQRAQLVLEDAKEFRVFADQNYGAEWSRAQPEGER